MIRNALPAFLCTLALCLVALPRAHALKADDVNCNKCVGKNDLAGKAASGKKIKKNAVTNKKVKKNSIRSSRVKDKTLQQRDLSDTLIQELGAAFLRVVDKDGKVVGPLHPGDSGVVLHTGPGAAEFGFIGIGQNGIHTRGTVFYSQPDCKGTPYTNFVPEVIVMNVLTLPLNNALKTLDIGFDPVTGELAALVAADSAAGLTQTPVQSNVSRVIDGVGNIAYQCSNGNSNEEVVEARVARHIADIDNPPFAIRNGQ